MKVSNGSNDFSKVIAFEGMTGAGKTSLLLGIAHELAGKCIILPEMRPEPDSSWRHASVKEQGKIFHRLWVERIHSIKKFQLSDISFLLDRSYISNLAFSYALDSFIGTDYYSNTKADVERDLDIIGDFSSIIVLNANPKCGLKRRKRAGDIIDWPWSEENFLHAFCEFYQKELPKFNIQVTNINTDKLSQEEVKKKATDHIYSILGQNLRFEKQKAIDPESVEKILKFAKKHFLGEIHSHPLMVFDYPTVYFRKFGIQLDNKNNPQFFNNEQLKEFAKGKECLG